MTLEAPAPAPPADEPAPERTGLERLIRVGGVVVSVLATILSALLELFLTPLRADGVPIGLAVVVAVAGNYAISWFALTTVGRRWALGPPWALWTAIMFFAAGTRTAEGDFLIAGDNWIALVMILAGSLTFAVFTYRAILRGPTVTKS
ncbi:hypothetical protein [Actinoplanes sp. NPDC049316]|uniref:hypothetical protein n=1 Tax=Actinoplanes sp. NPDC049316 TaxID=3154727 RepID=UPI00343C1387